MDVVGDTHDAAPGDGQAKDANNKTSLRAAIEEGNALTSAHTINFDGTVFAGPQQIGGEQCGQ